MREYSDFDKQCFPQERSQKDSRDHRTQFAIDRDRIIHSRAFRRLQAKTQIFSIGEYDFYHTRLTHSVEVAQIGRSICRFLNYENDKFEVDSDLVEAACLSHDIGNPPFGHSGERTLNRCMKKYGGFEGNAQTLRLLAERMFKSKEDDKGKREGIKPTRALMDAVCKYKDFWADEKEKHFLYKEQKACLQFVHEEDISFKEQSIECQIMDWSDDIANAYADVNDGIKARLIDVSSVEQWVDRRNLDGEGKAYIGKLIKSMKDRDIERFRANEIGKCITGVKMVEWITYAFFRTIDLP